MPVVGQLIRVTNSQSRMVQREINEHGPLWVVIGVDTNSLTAKALTSGKLQIFIEGEWEEAPPCNPS